MSGEVNMATVEDDAAGGCESQVMRYRLRQVEIRLLEGAQTFSDLRNAMNALSKDVETRMQTALDRCEAQNEVSNKALADSIREQLTEMKGAHASQIHEMKETHGTQLDVLKKDLAPILNPKRIGWLQLVAFGLSAIMAIGGVVVVMARQPGRGEFDTLAQRFIDLELDLARRGLLAPGKP